MVETSFFYEILKKYGLSFFSGVPDSLLKDLCAYIQDNSGRHEHVVAANEGNAVGIATGYYLGTGNPAVVYMQNSGIGNAINPLLSLADKSVYSIPMLLIIGWRGQPGIKDEPQHLKQGKITCDLLRSMDMPYIVLSSDKRFFKKQLKDLICLMKKENRPVCCVVPKGIFKKYNNKKEIKISCGLSREEAIEIIISAIGKNDVIVSTTGKASREVYELKEKTKVKSKNYFLTVGSMGHASQIALGLSLAQKGKRIYCLDGDGALLMHAGGMATIAEQKPKNLVHILLNNNIHDSVGGQKLANTAVDYQKLAKSFGYNEIFLVKTKNELLECMNMVKKGKGPIFLQICINNFARKDLIRPTQMLSDLKFKFMNFLGTNDAKRI
ncbi:MAG: phosphonopyruvate decarboxylase [Candidatus Omnitrophota bacterium]